MKSEKVKESHSVVSDSMTLHGLYSPYIQSTRLLYTCNSPGKNTGVSCQSLLQGIFPNQGSNPGILHHRQILYQLCHMRSFFVYFNRKVIVLQYYGGFCHALTWISHGCTCVPHCEHPSHIPPHPISLGCRSALAFSAPFHSSNLDWSSLSHMVTYMFQCYSLKSSHPCLFPESKSLFFTSVSLLLPCI